MTPRIRIALLALGLTAGQLLAGCAPHAFLSKGPCTMPGPTADLQAAQVAVTGRVSPYRQQPAALYIKPPDLQPAVAHTDSPLPPPETEPELVAAPAVVPERLPIRLEQAPQPGPPAPEEPLLAALRCLLEKRPDQAIELLRSYDRLNQEMLLGSLALAVRLIRGDLERARPEDVAHVLEQLDSLSVRLRPRALLAIEKMHFCREIHCFGGYKPLPEYHEFQAGREGRSGEPVTLYLEVANFCSQPRGPCYETRLATRLEVRDVRGELVWTKDLTTDQPDRSHTLRHDYFIACRFAVPSNLPPGNYTLWVEVRDLTGQPAKDVPRHRIARRSLDFRVTASAPLRRPAATPGGGTGE